LRRLGKREHQTVPTSAESHRRVLRGLDGGAATGRWQGQVCPSVRVHSCGA
jgi:hypothetical protein